VEGKVIFFPDEIQYLKDPSNLLKLLYDEHVHRKELTKMPKGFLLDYGFGIALSIIFNSSLIDSIRENFGKHFFSGRW
jgi:hypothetical protein